MRQSPQNGGSVGVGVVGFWPFDMPELYSSYEQGRSRRERPAVGRWLPGWRFHWLALLLAVGSWAATLGCTAKTEPPGVEEAYAARSSVALLEELDPNAVIVAHLEMGDRVQILGRRRSFVRVRSDDGREGWAKSTELITPDIRDLMMQVREQTMDDPPQGVVRALDTLNVHLEPYRWSPTIYQLSADEGAQLLRHKVVDRLEYEPQEGKPPPPANGQDDWYLVRLETGRAGWVLTRGVYSGIPEEVAQYAERRRIVSYFEFGKGVDLGTGDWKETWLWTQVSDSNQPHDFDLLRVFLWSKQREAYQTIKIERGLRGYLPVVLMDEVEAERGSGPGFSVIVEDKDGERVQRTYALVRNRVVRVSEEPAPPPRAPIRFFTPEPLPPAPTFMERLTSWWEK